MRRGFVNLEDSQVHFRRGRRRGGVPLVMLHGSPGSGYSLLPYARILSSDRDVIVFDTPGNGDSSRCAKREPTIPDLAAVIGKAASMLGLDRYDIYGYHTGASLALAVSLMESSPVRKIILDGVSFFSDQDRQRLMRHDHAPEIELHVSGSHLTQVWDMVRSAHIHWPWWDKDQTSFRGRDIPDAKDLHFEALEVLKAIDSYYLSYRAALSFDKTGYLSRVDKPLMAVCSPKDQLRDHLSKVASYCPSAIVKEVPGFDTNADAEKTCGIFAEFLA